jgi:hypothetical protein
VHTCNNCDSKLYYSEKWAALYCAKCNRWYEKSCEDPDCFFQCSERPEFPIKNDIENINGNGPTSPTAQSRTA